MPIRKLLPQTTRAASARAAEFLPFAHRLFLLAILGGAVWLSPAARAELINTFLEGPASAPYSYNLTVEFQNSHYYNFVLRSNQPTLTGYDFINTVQSLTLGMAVDQVSSSFGFYINGITIGSDTNSGFTNNSYWAYWNGSATDPIAWSFANAGESDTTLTPGQADGWVYSTGVNPPQATAIAAPEPTAFWMLLALPLAGWLLRCRVRRGRRVILRPA